MDKAIIEAFAALFKGRTDAWGSVEGRSNKEPVTLKHYQRHLEGKESLGIYMLNDDGTCNFFAIDLDEHSTPKALLIRKAFITELQMPIYIAVSKGKGYHLYGFADHSDPFVAADIRQLCNGVLRKLKIDAEVFPKQDKLDPEYSPLGNYINLPCFGATRPFINADLNDMPLEDAMKRIMRIPKAGIRPAVDSLPQPVQPVIQKVKDKGRPKGKSKQPPCIETMLRGVGAGSRDVAAFALARRYLDELYLPQEVLGLLQVWDQNNKPPLNDVHILETKVRSASKGYSFGCSSVIEEPLLASHCVGQETCRWLKQVQEEQKKRGVLREQSFHESETHLYEEVIQEGKALFASYDKTTREVVFINKVEYPDLAIVPIMSDEITYGAVVFPSGTEEYGDTVTLKNDVRQCILDYVDMDPMDLEFAAWYILLSWVFDKLTTISYLHFMGDTGCGKSRALDVVGRLCYKPLMMAGAVTPAPIFRLIKRFRGTLILEEADFRDSTEKSEVITILNCGFELNRPVIRCSQDNPDNLQVLPVFGPKVFATRFDFKDVALDARCMKFKMVETDREDIPPLLGTTFQSRAMKLRNKLLLWRFHNLNLIDSDVVEEISLGPEYLEPRLKQIALPYAIPFKDFPDVMEEFRKFMQDRQRAIVLGRGESDAGKVVLAFFRGAVANGRDQVSGKVISEILAEESKVEKTSSSIGKITQSLGITASNRRVSGSRARYLKWENKLMRKLLRRYVPEKDKEEFLDLFDDEIPEMEV